METEAAAVAALPDDVLAAVLGRLPPRCIAASRRVCQAWRDLVDGRRLLVPHLLPHSVRGFFVNYVDHGRPHFFARPAATAGRRRIDGKFRYVRPVHTNAWYVVADHCNGLVLYRDVDHDELYACNPTTRRWVCLPPLAVDEKRKRRVFLVFDPTVSRHYQVLMAPLEPAEKKPQKKPAAAGDTEADDGAWRSMEWPPSRWTWHIFSSRTGRWRERVFVREGEAAGMVADLMMDSMRYHWQPRWRYAAYWQGALYLHCRGEYVSRLSLSTDTYQIIKSPIDRAECYNNVWSFIGRLQKGVYFVAIHRRRLRVWILNELHRRMEWVLKHDRVLKPDDWWKVVLDGDYFQIQNDGPWILDDYYNKKAKRNVEWSSDDDDIIDTAEGNNDEEEYVYPHTFHVLGFHPYKEVIFLTALNVAVAYHLDSSKVQFLGILKPSEWNHGVYDSFVYTPCIRPAA
ncbi:hypothetical protein ACP70R_008068 [Stipagrostis hirtigluma subsp. patula]